MTTVRMYARTQKIRGLTTWIQKALVRKNKNLTAALKESRQENVLKRMADLQLQHDYEKAIATFEWISTEILETYAGRQHRDRIRNQRRNRDALE